MSNLLEGFSRLVTARPYVTLLVLALITVVLAAGATLRAPLPTTEDTLPEGGRVATALAEIEELFGESSESVVVTIIFRGDPLTPGALSQMDELTGVILAEPSVRELLAPDNPVVALPDLVRALLQVGSFESVTRAQVEAAPGPPELKAAIDAITGTDVDGSQVAIATIRLRDTGDERTQDAERWIGDAAAESQGPLSASTLSPTIYSDAYKRATEEGMAPLIGMAMLLIAALLLLFMRTISDLLLTLAGLFISIIWLIGAEGWLGPNGLGLTGPPNSLTSLAPIIIIGLTVDYAIQIVSHYRERRLAGDAVSPAVRGGMRNVTVPLTLAATTTTVSLFASLFSPIGIVGDFGVVAGIGVAMSLIVMLMLVPAGRAIIDRRREARGTLRDPRPIATALPGVQRGAEILGRSVTRTPAPYIIGVIAITVVMGIAATGLESKFSIRDILPRGGEVLKDMDTLDAAVGGSTEIASLLVKAEATQTRTLLNLQDLTNSFADPQRRPTAATGPIQGSLEMVVSDWTHDSGQPGDKYDAGLADLFGRASAGVSLDPVLMQQFLDELQQLDPAISRLMVEDPEGVDTMLLQFPIYAGVPGQTKKLQEEIESLWFGEDDGVTAVSLSIISFTVTDAITERQSEAIGFTVAAAIIVLSLFFWITARQPALAFIAVGPIVLVLVMVLGTMALLNIPYTLITSIITALSIGIGVDYTIHVIHRYREEYARERDPERAAIRTLSTTGSALLGSAMTTALGIGVLVASPLAASQQFGITAAVTIAYSLIVSIVLVPPAMTVWGAYQNMRLRSRVQRWAVELDEEIDAIYSRHAQEQG